MNLLLDNIELVTKEKIQIPFNSNFRTVILFEIMMQDNRFSERAKTYKALELFYPELDKITDVKKAIDDIVWFYSCGKREEKTSQKNKKGNKKARENFNRI